MSIDRYPRRAALAALAASTALAATGCAPLLFTGAVAGTAMSVSDRRTLGIQVEDQAIELRLLTAFNDKFPSGSQARVSATSYNRRVLLTGEVPNEQVRAEAQAIAERSLNVAAVLNELYVGPLSTFANRNFDRALAAKVLAALVSAEGVPSATMKVVTSRSVVYLMGLVTEREGEAAARVAARVSGVQKVVKHFEVLTEQEAAARTVLPAGTAPAQK